MIEALRGEFAEFHLSVQRGEAERGLKGNGAVEQREVLPR